ncbi:Small ubiquitin-related modifier 2 [Tetrabaena socialis]|uniref:Small ubiquitin-related modifier 2 n=1 Tax=Tetrabaena socialis TaxID=47790 RepID=A0A2J8A7H8_9CHLO|nr:Small ubiquitin-related modifier 2 [Tetrabaena socialis]|eukprot:PNH08482.1 Small ubiquitin-related modifier 2 [Tetrabaena socialis]
MGVASLAFSEADPLGGQDLSQPQSDVEAYRHRCSQLWSALQRHGVLVLELSAADDAALRDGLKASRAGLQAFYNANASSAYNSRPGEGYERRLGKDLLSWRMGSAGGSALDTNGALAAASERLDRLARAVLRDVCRGTALGVPEPAVGGLLEDRAAVRLRARPSASVLRAASYSAAAPPDSLAFAPHHDRGVLTLVASDEVAGLQALLQPPRRDARADGSAAGPSENGAGAGEWADVPLGPRRVAVLAGYSLSYALGGLLRPNLHRVTPPGSGAGSSGRVSLAYELCFRPAALVDPAAVLREAATRPARAPGRALHTSQLMELFSLTHPRSINGAGVTIAALEAADTLAAAAGAAACGMGPKQTGGAAGGPGRPVSAPLLGWRRGAEAEGEGGGGGKARRLTREGGRDGRPADVASAVGAPNQPPPHAQPQPQQLQEQPQPQQPLPQPPGGPSLNIIVRDQCGADVSFRVRPCAKMGAVLNAYAWKEGLDPCLLKLIFRGRRLGHLSCPAGLGLADGDIIDAMREQVGN